MKTLHYYIHSKSNITVTMTTSDEYQDDYIVTVIPIEGAKPISEVPFNNPRKAHDYFIAQVGLLSLGGL